MYVMISKLTPARAAMSCMSRLQDVCIYCLPIIISVFWDLSLKRPR